MATEKMVNFGQSYDCPALSINVCIGPKLSNVDVFHSRVSVATITQYVVTQQLVNAPILT